MDLNKRKQADGAFEDVTIDAQIEGEDSAVLPSEDAPRSGCGLWALLIPLVIVGIGALVVYFTFFSSDDADDDADAPIEDAAVENGAAGPPEQDLDMEPEAPEEDVEPPVEMEPPTEDDTGDDPEPEMPTEDDPEAGMTEEEKAIAKLEEAARRFQEEHGSSPEEGQQNRGDLDPELDPIDTGGAVPGGYTGIYEHPANGEYSDADFVEMFEYALVLWLRGEHPDSYETAVEEFRLVAREGLVVNRFGSGPMTGNAHDVYVDIKSIEEFSAPDTLGHYDRTFTVVFGTEEIPYDENGEYYYDEFQLDIYLNWMNDGTYRISYIGT